MSSIEQLTKTVADLQKQVKELVTQNAPYQPPVIHQSWYCGYCSEYFYSETQKLNHPCTPEVQAARQAENEQFHKILYGTDEPKVTNVRMVNVPTALGIMTINEKEAQAMAAAEAKEGRKRISLQAHDRAMGAKI